MKPAPPPVNLVRSPFIGDELAPGGVYRVRAGERPPMFAWLPFRVRCEERFEDGAGCVRVVLVSLDEWHRLSRCAEVRGMVAYLVMPSGVIPLDLLASVLGVDRVEVVDVVTVEIEVGEEMETALELQKQVWNLGGVVTTETVLRGGRWVVIASGPWEVMERHFELEGSRRVRKECVA